MHQPGSLHLASQALGTKAQLLINKEWKRPATSSHWPLLKAHEPQAVNNAPQSCQDASGLRQLNQRFSTGMHMRVVRYGQWLNCDTLPQIVCRPHKEPIMHSSSEIAAHTMQPKVPIRPCALQQTYWHSYANGQPPTLRCHPYTASTRTTAKITHKVANVRKRV